MGGVDRSGASAQPARGRIDALDKARGATVFTGDVTLPGVAHAVIVRSEHAHAVIREVDTALARSQPGVLAVVTAADVTGRTYGRRVRDMPVLASDRVRYVGERVAAVVAETRRQAEAAAALVVVDYEPLEVVADVTAALAPGAPTVHEHPWEYPGAAITETDPSCYQSINAHGDADATDAALASAPVVIDRTYTTPSGHAGYLEPQVTVAHVSPSGHVDLWVTDKGPYRLRREVAACLGLAVDRIVVHPVAIGGDFGGKGSYAEAVLCTELSRIVGRTVRLALRHTEDLAVNPARHSSTVRLRLAAEQDGTLLGLRLDAASDGGAYAACKPRPHVDLHGFAGAGAPYRIPAVFADSRIVYTHSMPRGHVRTPGAPQAVFAVESALDELAHHLGIDPFEIRRANLLRDGDTNPYGHRWREIRAHEVLDAADAAVLVEPERAPVGWRIGRGVAVFDKSTPNRAQTSMRLRQLDDGRYEVGVPQPETGTGSHTVVREAASRALDVDPDRVVVRGLATEDLDPDAGVGGSRVTVAIDRAVSAVVDAWNERGDASEVTVGVDEPGKTDITSFCVQVALVAVDPGSGQVRLLDLVTAIDVADVVNPAAHQMQIDGGTAMGLGFAVLEDLALHEGKPWATNLGSFKLPSTADVPPLRTILLEGGQGIGGLNVKAIGELTNVPTAAALANAVDDAVGVRIRDLPLKAEAVWRRLHDEPREQTVPPAPQETPQEAMVS